MRFVRSAVGGAVAGVLATAAMDALLYRRDRAGDGDDDFTTWEFSTTATSYDDDAPAPARVGKRIADAVGIELNPASVAVTNNIVHWATGIGWGKFAGLTASVVRWPALNIGVATGVIAWGTSYAVLGAVGIYEPIGSYDLTTLWKDLSAHLVFGTVVGTILIIDRRLQR